MVKRLLILVFALFLVSDCPISAYPRLFEDVPLESPYSEAISWAVENNITKGVDSTHFAPSQKCSRANILTFIWRACGSFPESGENPFDDTAGRYYEDAAHWAYTNGYETGEEYADKRFFYGSTPCTRSMAIIYLWNLAGRPVSNLDDVRVFRDLNSYSSVYSLTMLQAIAWAVNRGITVGTSADTFSPETVCTRGQIITFLYRYEKSM